MEAVAGAFQTDVQVEQDLLALSGEVMVVM